MTKIVIDPRQEPRVQRFLYSKEGRVFVDIGAAKGLYSLLLSDNFERIYAFEPEPISFKLLTENIKKWKKTNIKSYKVAIGHFNGTVTFNLGTQNKDRTLKEPWRGSTILTKEEWRDYIGGQKLSVQFKTSIQSKIYTLSEFFKDKETEIDLIKIDTEGAEFKILDGADKILSRINSWLIEIHLKGGKQRIQKWACAHNYHFTWITPQHIFLERKKE